MKKYFICLLLLVLSQIPSFGQLTVTSQASCTSYTLTASLLGSSTTTTGLSAADDAWSSAINLGFTYNFYGTNHTQCIIGTNGEVGFDLTYAGSYNTWPITATLQATAAGGGTDIHNLIAGVWCDLLISAGGSAYYSTIGTAPNRKFVVTFCGVHMFSCTAQWTTSQIILYETSNIAEVHIGHKTFCTSWNGGYAETGVVNNSGSAATVAPGPPVEDYPVNWNATNLAWRFTPNATSTAYSVTSIPYAPIPNATSNIYWYDSSTNAYIGSGSNIVVAPSVTTTYMVAAVGCQDTIKAYITVAGVGSVGSGIVGIPNISAITSINPSLCGSCDGIIKLFGITPHQVDTVFWTINGIPQAPFIDSTGTDSTMTFTGLCQGTYAYYVKVGLCPSNTMTATLTMPPPIQSSFTYETKLGCNGDSVILTNTTTPSSYHYYWYFGDGSLVDSTDFNVTHVYGDAPSYTGTYNIILTYNTTYDPACLTSSSVTVSFNHPIDAHITSVLPDTSVCWMVPMNFTGSTISADMPSMSWDFGNASQVLHSNPVDYTYPQPGNYTVKLTVEDTIGCIRVDSEHVHVVQIAVHTSPTDTSVCLRDSMMLHGITDIIPSDVPYNVNWTPTNNIGNAGSPDVNFMGVGDFVYTVTSSTPYPACTSSDTLAIHSYPPITITNLTASQTIPWGSTIQLNADGGYYYRWAPDDGSLDNPNINNPIAAPIDSITTYTVYAMSEFGCLDSASLTIRLDNTMTQLVPSAFTPNGDGLNDVFRITKLTFQKLVEFRIFNRWGQQVFQTSNPEMGWDGTFNGVPQDMGVYTYEIIVGLVDGTLKTYKGTVTLIR